MNRLIQAALDQRDELLYNNQMLLEVVEDMSIPEEKRLEADMRIAANDNSINYFEAMAAGLVERLPITDVLDLIQCKHDGNAISAVGPNA